MDLSELGFTSAIDLAARISREVDGKNMLDVATALSGMIAFAISESTPSLEERQSLLNTLVEFMNKQIRQMPGGEQ